MRVPPSSAWYGGDPRFLPPLQPYTIRLLPAALSGVVAKVFTAKALGLNVTEYLADVIDKLAGGWDVARIREFIPDAWAAARPTTADPAPQ